MFILNKYLNGKIAELISHGLAGLMAILIAHGASADQATGFAALFNPESIAAAVVGAINLIWGMVRSHYGNKLVSAVDSHEKGAEIMHSAVRASVVLLCLGIMGNMGVMGQTTNTNNVLLPAMPTTIKLPLVQITGVTSNEITVANDVLAWVAPMLPFLTNHDVTLGIAPVLYDGKIGELMDLRLPVAKGSPLSIGIGEAYMGNELFIAPISAKLGTTFTVPVINRKVYAFAEEGAALRLTHKLALGSQTVAGALTTWDLNNALDLNTEGGVVKLTQLPKPGYFFGLSLRWHPAKW